MYPKNRGDMMANERVSLSEMKEAMEGKIIEEVYFTYEGKNLVLNFTDGSRVTIDRNAFKEWYMKTR